MAPADDARRRMSACHGTMHRACCALFLLRQQFPVRVSSRPVKNTVAASARYGVAPLIIRLATRFLCTSQLFSDLLRDEGTRETLSRVKCEGCATRRSCCCCCAVHILFLMSAASKVLENSRTASQHPFCSRQVQTHLSFTRSASSVVRECLPSRQAESAEF